MIYIDNKPNPSGAYPNPTNEPFPGCIALTDEQAEIFFAYNGFVSVQIDGESVIVSPDVTAWKAWKASTMQTLSPSEQRKNAYETEKVVHWAGNILTVSEAGALWQYYAAEGSAKADQLQALISDAKAQIREEFPDQGGPET